MVTLTGLSVFSDNPDDDRGGGDLRHVLASAEHHQRGGGHRPDHLRHEGHELHLDDLSLAGHEQLHVQPLHLLLDERQIQERLPDGAQSHDLRLRQNGGRGRDVALPAT